MSWDELVASGRTMDLSPRRSSDMYGDRDPMEEDEDLEELDDDDDDLEDEDEEDEDDYEEEDEDLDDYEEEDDEDEDDDR